MKMRMKMRRDAKKFRVMEKKSILDAKFCQTKRTGVLSFLVGALAIVM